MPGRTIVDPFDVERIVFDFHKQKTQVFEVVTSTLQYINKERAIEPFACSLQN